MPTNGTGGWLCGGICQKQQAFIKKEQEWPRRSRNLVPVVEASYFLALWNCHFFSQLWKHGYAWDSLWRPLNMLHQCWWLWCRVQFCSWFSYKFVICLFEQNADMPSTFSYLMWLPIDLALDMCRFKSKYRRRKKACKLFICAKTNHWTSLIIYYT